MKLDSERLLSLDALRGYTIAAMLLVNFPGNWDHVYPFLLHSRWNGLTFTDLVAPFFLFIVGVSVVLAYTKRVKSGESRGRLYRKIGFRSIKIFLVGIFLNVLAILPDFSWGEMRWTGTLPRIAIVFLACGFLFFLTDKKGQALVGGSILVGYWIIMCFVPTPGLGRVSLEPGLNVAAWVDIQLLPGKMWQGSWDPEGILSTFPAIVSGITGMLAGHLLVGNRRRVEKAVILLAGGWIAFAAGCLWNLSFPVNENIWTSSFVLVTSGMASMTLGTVYYLVDIKGARWGIGPGVIFGTNAITTYVLGDLLSVIFYRIPFPDNSLNRVFFDVAVSLRMDPKPASLVYGLIFVGIVLVPVWMLFRNRIFIKL